MASATGLGVLRMGEGNQRHIAEAVLGPLPVETNHLDHALDGGRLHFLCGPELDRQSIRRGKESRFQEISSSSSHDHL